MLGALEVALDQSDRQLEHENALADEYTTDASFGTVGVECEHCQRSVTMSSQFFAVRNLCCEHDRLRTPSASNLNAELECPLPKP